MCRGGEVDTCYICKGGGHVGTCYQRKWAFNLTGTVTYMLLREGETEDRFSKEL